jgi:hypothetical protein
LSLAASGQEIKRTAEEIDALGAALKTSHGL